MNELFIWLGIAFCISQSAIFSGLNLAFFSLTRLRLEIEAEAEHTARASKVLAMRRDSNFLLTTILWGNVGINVLLTLLSDSVMAGLVSFMFATVVITIFGEIMPQAYFSRNALKMASILSPVLKFYQFLLYPVAKPCALALDTWLGKESAQFFTEQNIMMFIKKHIDEENTEIEHIEGTGAINFLSLDEQMVTEEGEPVNPQSIIQIKSENGQVLFPKFNPKQDDPFLIQINLAGEKWIIFVDENEEPVNVLDADGFLRAVMLGTKDLTNNSFCHKPLVIKDDRTDLGTIIKLIKRDADQDSDNPIDIDVVLLWNAKNKRIITGADLFGRLIKGI